MQIYFAHKSGKPVSLLFNSNQPQLQSPPPQQLPRQMAVSRKSILLQDKQQTLKDKIKVEVLDMSYTKLKLNPAIYAFNLNDILSNQKMENIEFLDEMNLKNKEKQQNYQDLITISGEIANMGQTKTVIKRSSNMNDPARQIMNLTGCDYGKAQVYLQKFKTVEKVFQAFQTQSDTVQQFVTRFKVKPSEASFYLQSSDYNINQAARLMNHQRL